MSQDADQPPDYTRADVHELVWSRPVKELSALFLLSGRGIAKACAAHKIPVPGRGYWQKVEAGLPVEQEPLPLLPEFLASAVVFSAHEINQRRNRTTLDAQFRITRVPRPAPARKSAKVTAAIDLPKPIPPRPQWAGPEQPAFHVLAAIDDWRWEYSFAVLSPGESALDDPWTRRTRYLEVQSILIFASVLQPQKQAKTRLRFELRPFTLLDARDDGEVRAVPVGEWWKERGTIVGKAQIPNNAAAAIISALAAGKVAYLTINGQAKIGREPSDVYGVELGTTYDPEDWE